MCPMSVWLYLRLSVVCILKWRFLDAKQISALSWQIKSYGLIGVIRLLQFIQQLVITEHFDWTRGTSAGITTQGRFTLCITAPHRCVNHFFTPNLALRWSPKGLCNRSHVINITGLIVCVAKFCGLLCSPWCPDAGGGEQARSRTHGLRQRHTSDDTFSPVLTLDYVMVCIELSDVPRCTLSENGDGHDWRHSLVLCLHINSQNERHEQTCAAGISAILLIIADCIIYQTRLASGETLLSEYFSSRFVLMCAYVCVSLQTSIT